MKKYQAPELKIVCFSAQDILTFSNETNLPLMPVGEGEDE